MPRQLGHTVHLAWLLLVLLLAAIACTSSAGNSSDERGTSRPSFQASSPPGASVPGESVMPFTDISESLGEGRMIDNRLPGVAIFDYDRDGDLDFYVTNAEVNAIFPITMGGPNRLFRNDGNNRFTNVAAEAGVELPEQNSTGVVACDFDGNGYQDLYVGGQGRIGDNLDYRSIPSVPDLAAVSRDRLLMNDGDGTFTDSTASALGDAANLRSAASVACADVDGDGWVDIFVGNRADVDFVRFDNPRHHGHYNVLYRNRGDGTFEDVTDEAGLRGPEIVMRDPFGNPIEFEDPVTGARTEGYDPKYVDALGNTVGDPTGQTWAILFFDHDDDGDQDLWIVDDGDRTKVYRNDTDTDEIRFRDVAREMGIDLAGAGMGFAAGDYDSDGDLDVFVTNIGYHPLTRPVPQIPGGDCAYAHRFAWGSCFHYLLENRGTMEVPGVGTVPRFVDTAASMEIVPSRFMPPDSLDPRNIGEEWQIPSGLQAYDFGFGTAFFDMENDGDQDLYWLGSMVAKGEGPRGQMFPSAGRMLRNLGGAQFEDVTVEAHLLDVLNVDYSVLDPTSSDYDAARQRIGVEFHENGKGIAVGDLNGDGFVDMIATNAGSEVFRPGGDIGLVSGTLFVWMNGGGGSDWLTVRLKGRGEGASNIDAVGARLVLEYTDGDGVERRQVREVTASSSYLSMNALDQYFGLGEGGMLVRLTVYWPSGRVQQIKDLEPGQVLTIEEPNR